MLDPKGLAAGHDCGPYAYLFLSTGGVTLRALILSRFCRTPGTEFVEDKDGS